MSRMTILHFLFEYRRRAAVGVRSAVFVLFESVCESCEHKKSVFRNESKAQRDKQLAKPQTRRGL